MLIQASKNGWKEVTADQNYFGETQCAQYSSYTKFGSTGRHWPTPSNIELKSTIIKKPRKITLNEIIKIVERYECALQNHNDQLILHGEPEDLVRALSKLATLATA